MIRKRVKIASSKEYLEFILEQLSDLEAITYRPMMGEYILYYRGKVVGNIYDDRFLVKPTGSANALMPAADREVLLVDFVDDRDLLKELLEAMYYEPPAPKNRGR